jgi:cation diffusion facilitator CzcD-associated flavoprotein CzcO
MEQSESTNFSRPISTVAVIGFGPAGLAASRRLTEACLKVTIFERKSQAGGTWYDDL